MALSSRDGRGGSPLFYQDSGLGGIKMGIALIRVGSQLMTSEIQLMMAMGTSEIAIT